MIRNVSFYTWENPNGSISSIQEIHPNNTDASTEDILSKVEWKYIAGGATAEALIKELTPKMPKKRVYIKVEDGVGMVGFYPKLTQNEKSMVGIDRQN